MKTVELTRLMKRIEFPNNYKKQGRLAYKLIEHTSGLSVLIGFYLDTTSDKDKFFLQYFLQCLYVPFPTFNFSLGDRLGGYLSKEDINKINSIINNTNKVDKINTFEDVILYINKNKSFGHEVNKYQYLAYTYFIIKEYNKSIEYLNKIILLNNHPNKEWFSQEIENAEKILCHIERENYEEGLKLLSQWQKQTMKDVRLI